MIQNYRKERYKLYYKSHHTNLQDLFSRFSCHAVISARNSLSPDMTADDRKACR